MRKMMCAFAAAGLLAGLASADSHVSSRLTKQDVRESKGRIGSFVVNHLTGELSPGGGTNTDATIVYDNTINLGAFVAAANVGSELGDDLVMIAGGQVTELSLSLWNSDLNGGDLISCDIEIKFHDYQLNLIDSVVIPVDLSAQPLGPGFVVSLTTDDLTAENIVLPRYVFMTQTVTNPVGAGIFEVGAALNNPVEVGWSADLFYLDLITNNFFGGDVTANIEYAVTVDTPTGETLIDTTGAPHSVNFDPGTGFAPTFLGFSSGDLGGANTQRWAAIPFSVASNTSIGVVDAYGFAPAGSEPDNVSYIIWKRTGLNKPLSNADKFAEGVLGAYNPVGGLGPVVGSTGILYQFPLASPLAIPAGDYYLTVYGGGGTPPDNFAWFTGGDKQDEGLELQPSSMWRSAAFPAPGFIQYSSAAIQPLPAMLDPDDQYNPCFALWAPGGECEWDLNGDGRVCQEDLGQLLAGFGTIYFQPDLGGLLAEYGTCGDPCP